MHCEQARHLFDAYLDGDLSPSLATELGAHRLRCADCRQALALLEVSGHILRSDRDPVAAPRDFTDRLLACVDSPGAWRHRLWNTLYVGGPVAAAAVIALAFLGVFDGRGKSQVAGVKEIVAPPMVQRVSDLSEIAQGDAGKASTARSGNDAAARALDEFVDRTQQRMRNNGESLQRVMDLTILQMLDILEEAKDRANRAGPYQPVPSAAPATLSPMPESADDSDDAPPPEFKNTEDAPEPGSGQ